MRDTRGFAPRHSAEGELRCVPAKRPSVVNQAACASARAAPADEAAIKEAAQKAFDAAWDALKATKAADTPAGAVSPAAPFTSEVSSTLPRTLPGVSRRGCSRLGAHAFSP